MVPHKNAHCGEELGVRKPFAQLGVTFGNPNHQESRESIQNTSLPPKEMGRRMLQLGACDIDEE